MDASGKPRMLGKGAYGQARPCTPPHANLPRHQQERCAFSLCIERAQGQTPAILLQVMLGRWRGALVAVKVLHEIGEGGESPNALADFRREADTLRSLRHPNILNFYGACFNSRPARLARCAACLPEACWGCCPSSVH